MSEINTVLLSGEVLTVKQNFTSDGTIFIVFTLKQRILKFAKGELIESSYMSYLCNCFENGRFKLSDIKVGNSLVVQGSLSTYIKKNIINTSINVEKIYVTRVAEN